jgi:hypothetical protein
MPYAKFLGSANMSLKITAARHVHWLVGILYGLTGLAFVLDLSRDNDLAYGIVYVPLIATALLHKHRSGLWLLTVVACLLVVLGALFPVVNSDIPDLIGNRVLSVLAILATAAFVQHACLIRDRLAMETRRAEAAERMTTMVLTELSQKYACHSMRCWAC